MISTIYLLVSCIKTLFTPAYHSTDFEVHRNWLAITHSLPINKWYLEDTSEWTLDYPPLFAWFEYVLSFFAKWFDADMLKVENFNYVSFRTVLFQRLTVIVTDAVFAYGAYLCNGCVNFHAKRVLPLLLMTNVGLLMVDSIHFQYNGLLYGVLLISSAKMAKGHYVEAAFWFTVLLNMKHLYLYMAPAYFVYLLRNYCFTKPPKGINFRALQLVSFKNTFRLGTMVILVFALTFLPFFDQLKQIATRLFPFKRGLCHAYWAPNVWSIYNVLDKMAVIVGRTMGFNITIVGSTYTSGLVQDFSHQVLPSIRPSTTAALTIIAMLPALYKLWASGANIISFLRCLVLCSLTSFLFGWHVHEKAILMPIIPLSILSTMQPGDAKIFLVLATVGHYSLFPLLFPDSLILLKVVMHCTWTCYAFWSISNLYPLQLYKYSFPMLNILETIYLVGLIPLFVFEHFVHKLTRVSEMLPFLPLMLTSTYCALGVIYCWLKLYIYYLNMPSVCSVTSKKKK